MKKQSNWRKKRNTGLGSSVALLQGALCSTSIRLHLLAISACIPVRLLAFIRVAFSSPLNSKCLTFAPWLYFFSDDLRLAASSAPLRPTAASGGKSSAPPPQKRSRTPSQDDAPLDGLFEVGVSTRSKRPRRRASMGFRYSRDELESDRGRGSGEEREEEGKQKKDIEGKDVDGGAVEDDSGGDGATANDIAVHAVYFSKQLRLARVCFVLRLVFKASGVA